MSARDTAVLVLLFVGIVPQVLGCLGVTIMRSALDRLHYGSFSVLAGLGVALAILVREGFSLIGDKALLVAAFMAVTSPVVVQVVGRAARIVEQGSLACDAADVQRTE